MGLSVTTVNKPLPGIATGNVPQELAEFLAIEVPNVLGNNDGKDKELFLSHDTEALAKQYAGYARAWGMREDGAQSVEAIGYQVEIKRIVNRRDMPDTQVRMTVRKYDPDAPRAGRPAGTGSANGETPAPTPPAQSDSKK
jgi:hypothetical protein